MLPVAWLRDLFAALSMATLVPAGLAAPPPITVPAVPVATAPAPVVPRDVFVDDFATPVTDHWQHVSTSTPDRVRQETVDGRSVVALGPEGYLAALAPIPYEVGATYRVSAAIQMPRKTGTHPAFWARTGDHDVVGEIDIVESWGGKNRCGRVQTGFYWRYEPPVGKVVCRGDAYPKDLRDWHEYSVEFTYMAPGRDPAFHHAEPTRFFVDGKQVWSTDHSPIAQESIRLQHKRNCPEAEQPTCGETSTGPDMLVDYVKVQLVDQSPAGAPADLITPKSNGAGGLEVHEPDPTSGYAAMRTSTAVPLPTGDWRYGTGDFDGDLAADLYAVAPGAGNTATVKILDGSQSFQEYVDQATIAVPHTPTSRQRVLVGDYDNNGRDDLYLVGADAWGGTTVRVLDAATGFQTELFRGRVAAPMLDHAEWDLTTGDVNGDSRDDLYLVDRDAGGTAALHVLDAATGFATFLVQTTTAAPALDPSTWDVRAGDQNADGRDDLYLLHRDDAGSTSVHVLDAATGFTTYLLETRTALPATLDPAWAHPES
jgi:hypothetical protein